MKLSVCIFHCVKCKNRSVIR